MSGIFSNRMDKTSWKAGWREIGGYKKYYRSRWEANYARYLERLKLSGDIVGWSHEPTTFWFEGVKRGVTNYLPDFLVEKRGEEDTIVQEYHEVKGYMDTKSATKIKRMEKYHPTVKLVVIDRPLYTNLEKEFASIIDGWEMLSKNKEDKVEKTVTEEPVKKPKRISKKKQQELEKQLV